MTVTWEMSARRGFGRRARRAGAGDSSGGSSGGRERGGGLAGWENVDGQLAAMLRIAAYYEGEPESDDVDLGPGEAVFYRSDEVRLVALARGGEEYVDEGPLVVTNRRVVLRGADHVVEWSLARLAPVDFDAQPLTQLGVLGRARPQWGLRYPAAEAVAFRFRLALAIAVQRDQRGVLVERLRRQQAEHDARRPDPASSADPAASARPRLGRRSNRGKVSE